MKKLLVVGLVCLSWIATSAWAEGPRKELVVKVEQAFMVGNTSYPAGSYQISTRGTDQTVLVIKNQQGGEAAEVPVLTRLARREAPGQPHESNIVFDKIGDNFTLSEVWLPGEDGYLVGERNSEHKHTIVPAVQAQN